MAYVHLQHFQPESGEGLIVMKIRKPGGKTYDNPVRDHRASGDGALDRRDPLADSRASSPEACRAYQHDWGASRGSPPSHDSATAKGCQEPTGFR